MPTDIRSLPAFFDGDTAFRGWVQGVHDQIALTGLVQTADTGQINPASATWPSANQFAGYEIWRFDDSLQSTYPVFIKVEYGAESPNDRPRLRVSLGTSTDGAGALAGRTTPTFAMDTGTSQSSGATLPSYCAGNDHYLALANNWDAASDQACLGFMVGRSRDFDGTATGDFAWIGGFSDGTNNFFRLFTFSGDQTASSRQTLPVSPAPWTQPYGVGLDFYPLPVRPILWREFSPLLELFVYRHTDIGELSPITMDVYEATRTYLPLGNGVQEQFAVETSGVTGHSVMILWE